MRIDEFEKIVSIGENCILISWDTGCFNNVTYIGMWSTEEGKDLLHFHDEDIHIKIPLSRIRKGSFSKDKIYY